MGVEAAAIASRKSDLAMTEDAVYRKAHNSERESGLKARPPLDDWSEGMRRVREDSSAILHGGWGVELRLYENDM